MKKFNKKYLFYFLIILIIVSFIWFDYIFLNENNKIFAENLKKAGEVSDVIIIFNAGGFGTVDFENAYDFKPIIDNLEKTIEDMNYSVSIVPYYRTKETIIGKIGYLKEMFFEFPKLSKYLSIQITEFLEDNPNDKVLMAGLSNGAAFVRATMNELNNVSDNVLAIEIGPPFWSNNNPDDKILFLDNNGRDTLTIGNKKEIIVSLLKTPFVWVSSVVLNQKKSLAKALQAPGHQYYWEDIKDDVFVFVQDKLK